VFFPPGDKLHQIDFPCQALLAENGPQTGFSEEKTKHLFPGMHCWEFLFPCNRARTKLEHRKGRDTLSVFAKHFSGHRKMPVITEVQVPTKP
jgi:hypothetical protein